MKNRILVVVLLCLAISTTKAQWTTSGTNIYNSNTSNVGIGTTTPAYKLDVNGNARIIASVFTSSNSPFTNSSIHYTETGAHNFFGVDGQWVSKYFGMKTDGTFLIAGGNVGIGTLAPVAKLEVKGAIRSSGTSGVSGYFEAMNVQNGNTYFLTNTISGNGIVNLNRLDGTTKVFLNSFGSSYFSGGNVLIGQTTQTNTNYLLDVAGNVRANKVVVNTSGADFVFDSSYKQKTLNEVEKFILTNHHLPDIPAAAEMQANGIDVGENQTKLLQKIEELTLYLIQQNKKIETLQSEINNLKEKK